MTWRDLPPGQRERNRRRAAQARAALKPPERATPQQAADQARDTPMPPPDMSTTVCARCGGHYLDNHAGHAAHHAVFGHTPETSRPTEQETTEP